jgi:hypothetical protein
MLALTPSDRIIQDHTDFIICTDNWLIGMLHGAKGFVKQPRFALPFQ